MTYVDQWKALSSRIRGLMKAGQLHAQYLAVRSSDGYGRGKRLREQIEGVLSALRLFRGTFHQSLPSAALVAIDDFVEKTASLIIEPSGMHDAIEERMWAALVSLAAFETQISFILSDVQESIRTRSERAFSHLQRSIVADTAFREKWLKAFEEGEIACERLGAVHLLLHGIWAYKVNAAGARTDLVFQEPAGDLISVERYAEGIVLTEWKKVGLGDDSARRFGEARYQARRYAQGALAGIELTNYRYAVVVSSEQIEVPEDLRQGEVVYRHINIAINPRLPSRG